MTQATMFADAPRAGAVDLGAGAWYKFVPRWLHSAESAEMFYMLRDAVPWAQRTMRFGGRDVPQPRQTAWYGDAGAGYAYSGIRNEPLPWTRDLDGLRHRVGSVALARFNSCLLNRYRTGADSVAWHSDDEPELGPDPIIASLSLGAARDFVIREKTWGVREPRRVVFPLGDGDLLIMGGTMQREWEHSVPKRKTASERINMTFRNVNR